MSFFQDVMLSGVERRKDAIDEARAAGRLGAARLPLSLSSDPTLSDTFIGKLNVALNEGRQQREADLYQRWLLDNADRLADQLGDECLDDGAEWLRRQYTLETGRQP